MPACPSASQLDDLLGGNASEADRQLLEAHLGECGACQQALQDLSGDATQWQQWQRLLQPRDETLHEPPAHFLHDLETSLRQQLLPGVEEPAGVSWPRIPGYEILSELGRGGTSVVYLARQTRLQRPVALKVLLTGGSRLPERLARFRAEAEAVARLRHPNIVQIYEVGEANGQPFLALEYVEGGSLTYAQALTPREAAELVEVVARAVQFAHEQGIVHRDLKPGNILRATDGTPKVTDFGLARRLETDETRLTQTGEVLGTPRYMAPEQARPRGGADQPIGPATDVYALGAVLYELLAGRPPFDAESALDTLLQVLEDEPLPLRQLRPQVPRDLETITLKCLEKSPGRRYGSAHDLALDLQRFLAGEPIRARPIGSVERLVKWARRRPAAAAALLATVLGLVGVSLALVQARAAQHNEAEQRRQALAALEQSEQSIYFGDIAQARAQWLLNNVAASQRLLDRCAEKRRGWEWHYLNGLHHADLLTIAHTGGQFVNGLAYTPDGRWLAAGGGNPFDGGQEGVIQVYDGDTGELRWRNAGLPFPVWGVAIHPDGKTLATASGNWRGPGRGEVKLWDLATGQLRRTLTEPDAASMQSVAFSPDGGRLAAACLDGSVHVWNVESGTRVFQLRHPAMTRMALFTPDGRWLITSADDGGRIWDAESGEQFLALPQLGSELALSPQGKFLVAANGSTARVYDLSETAQTRKAPLVDVLAGHQGNILSVAFGPDGRSIATAGADGTVRTWQLGWGAADWTIHRGHHGRTAALAFHPTRDRLASGGQQPGDIKVWDLAQPPEHTQAINFGEERLDVEAVAFKPDGTLLALGLGGSLHQWDSASGEKTIRPLVPSHNEWLVPSARSQFTTSGNRVVTVMAGQPSAIHVWDLPGQREVSSFREHTLKVWFVATDRAGERVASAAWGNQEGQPVREVKVWETASGKVLRSESQPGRTLALALSPDGVHLAESQLAGQSGSVRLIHLNTGQALDLSGAKGLVRVLTFSADGRVLAGARDDGAVDLWDVQTGRTLRDRPLEGPAGLANLAFNPDGTRLAGVNRERALVWDVASGQPVLFLGGIRPRANDNGFNPRIAWSSDGKLLAASTWDRTVCVWGVPYQK